MAKTAGHDPPGAVDGKNHFGKAHCVLAGGNGLEI
jgi:hypothetical protein